MYWLTICLLVTITTWLLAIQPVRSAKKAAKVRPFVFRCCSMSKRWGGGGLGVLVLQGRGERSGPVGQPVDTAGQALTVSQTSLAIMSYRAADMHDSV